VPLSPPVIASQEAALAAVHAHDPGAVTSTRPVPPSLENDALSGATAETHAAGCPACAIATLRPAISIVVSRLAPPSFLATA
jgi:hypothetical protein